MVRVIVGYDGSPSAGAALTWGRQEAVLHGADLEVVIAASHADVADPAPAQGLGTAGPVVTAARELVGSAATITVTRGKPAAELIQRCTNRDILVVGGPGHDTALALLLGSVSRACLHHAHCLVAVVRTRPDTPPAPHRRVIVAVDGSEVSGRALQVAAVEAGLRQAALHAVHVVEWDLAGVALVAPTTRQLVAWGKNLVDRELTASGVEARPVVIHGHPADVLVRHSSHADLLVLGSRGHGTIGGLMIGSVGDHCAQHAHCPVLVVPRSAADDPAPDSLPART